MTYQLVQTITLASNAASIDFRNIPQDATDLVFLLSTRASGGSGFSAFIRLDINGTLTNRNVRRLFGTGSSAGSDSSTGDTTMATINTPDTTSNTFTSTSIYVANYASTTTNKTMSIDSVTENNATGSEQDINVLLWSSTAAITGMDFVSSQTGFLAGSTVSLYKITKGSSGGVVVS